MEVIRGKIAKAQKVVIYGPEGIGKSTFAAQFPEPIFIDTEGSTNNMDVARLPKPSSWEMLNQQVAFAKMNRPGKTLVIDTIDWAEKLCIDYICAKSKKESITQFGYGEGFIQLEEEFGRFLNRLSELIDIGINVALTAHSKIVKFERPDEYGAYDRWELKLGNKTTAKTSALVKEWADMLLFANYKTNTVATDDKGKKFKGEGKRRMMYTAHDAAWDAKNRHGLPEELPFEYSAIAHCIVAPQPVPASAPVSAPQPVPAPSAVSAETTGTPPMPAAEKENIAQAPEPATEKSELDGIYGPLADLMRQSKVTLAELQEMTVLKGYYPANTPIENYDPQYMPYLISVWPQVLSFIEDNIRNEIVPF